VETVSTPYYPEHATELEKGPVWRLLGLKVGRLEPAMATVVMPVVPEILQGLGHVHGGILVTLLDSCMAAALNTLLKPGVMAVTAQLNTNYLRPGTGSELKAEARVIRLGTHLAVTEGRIVDLAGELVATATAQFFVLAD
jgi:uncharacterized protein (TIGR00369 family)